MSNLKNIVICLLFLCLGTHSAFSEIPEPINFSYISINEGLSQSTVFAIDQDKRGNMWFATYDGVNKYDGYAFTVYQHNEDDPNSIANDISRIVKTDSQGRVWIGTRDGLSYYDEEKDQFKNFFYEKKGKRQQVNGIAEISPEQLLVSTQEGLIMFDSKESKFVEDAFSTAMHKIIASALYRHGDIIYIALQLFRHSKKSGESDSYIGYQADSGYFTAISHPNMDSYRRGRLIIAQSEN